MYHLEVIVPINPLMFVLFAKERVRVRESKIEGEREKEREREGREREGERESERGRGREKERELGRSGWSEGKINGSRQHQYLILNLVFALQSNIPF